MVGGVMADVRKVLVYAVANGYFTEGHAQLIAEYFGISPGAARCAEAGHGYCQNIVVGSVQYIQRPD